jgi:FkbM family methyltransferase
MLLPYSYQSLVGMALGGVLFHRKLLEVLARVIRRGDVFVDGGSNLGFYSLWAAHLMGGQGRVFAFEPDPGTFALLRENVEANGLRQIVQIEQLALTDSNGEFDFSSAVDEPMMSSLLPRPDVAGRMLRVSGTRLDDYFASIGQERADVIKLDLEGAEPEALSGMSGTLRSARLLIFEINEPQLKAVDLDPLTLVSQTAEAGSFDTITFIDERNSCIRPWDRQEFARILQDHKFVNVLCAKRNCFPDGLS